MIKSTILTQKMIPSTFLREKMKMLRVALESLIPLFLRVGEIRMIKGIQKARSISNV